MSKRKGNGIDPHDVIEKFGSGPFRLWCAIEGNLDRTDFRCSFQRIEAAGKILEKLWNVSKFVSMFELTEEDSKDVELMEIDKWAIKEINEIAKDTKEKFMIYDFHNPVVTLMNFVRDDFASNYLEVVKRRAYNNDENVKFTKAQRNGAVKTLQYVLGTILEIIYPVEPAITHFLYKELFGEDISKKEWPVFEEVKSEIVSSDLIEFNSEVWKAKKDSGISLKDPVKHAVAPKSLANVEIELAAMHNIQKIEFSNKTEITVK